MNKTVPTNPTEGSSGGVQQVGAWAPQVPEPYITRVELAKRLGRSLRCIDNWMKRGLIPYFKIGKSVSFKWSEVEAELAQTCRVSRWAIKNSRINQPRQRSNSH